MATVGFEFAYMLDGTKAVPVQRDFILGASADHLKGDLMKMQTDGFVDAVTGTTTEVTCVVAEEVLTADATGGTTTLKCQVITRGQVWRCSSDAATAATALIGTIKTLDTVDKNTIDADDVSNGTMIVAEGDPAPEDIANRLDEEGNIIIYVVFGDTTFGNL